MLTKKITLNTRLRDFIISRRKDAQKRKPYLTADYVSENVGRAKSWLSQVENGRLKSVKANDLINVFTFLHEESSIVRFPEGTRNHMRTLIEEEIMYIEATIKLGFMDDEGNTLDVSKASSYNFDRMTFQHIGELTHAEFTSLQKQEIKEIENNLKLHIKRLYNIVGEDIQELNHESTNPFSDEVSTRNLYFLLETSVNYYNDNCNYYAKIPLDIHSEQLDYLKEKLNTNFFIRERTKIKPLDEYNNEELEDVVKHYTTEDFMKWKHKTTYFGNDPFPMTINFRYSMLKENDFRTFEDLNKSTGLS
ncbi:MAG: hypothetical protein LUF92_03760, partial [Clostridiales bacterium]|nr:hypothetical protein [Clostridiales bacterium]